MTKSLEPTGMILLVTACGGVLRYMLQNSGLGDVIGNAVANASLPLVLVAFIVAALVRISVGSATVAMTMAAGIISAMPGLSELSPLYLACVTAAIAGGSTVCSHFNDSGFWPCGHGRKDHPQDLDHHGNAGRRRGLPGSTCYFLLCLSACPGPAPRDKRWEILIHLPRYLLKKAAPGVPGAAFSASDQCHGNIVDIGAGGPCEDQPFHCLQGVVGIVVLQSVKNIPARCSQCGGGAAVHIAACGIGRAVGAVTAHREHTAVFQPRKGRGSGKRKLLISPAQPFAGQVHHRFPACDKSQPFALSRMGADNGAKKAARLPGFAAEPVGKDDRLIPQLPAGIGGGSTQFPHTAGDPGGHVVKGFRRFLRQQRPCLLRQVQPIFFRNGKRLCAGGGVRRCRAAGDHIQRVAQNIAEHDAEHPCGSAVLREPPALDCGQPFADGVHLYNVGSAGS